MRMAFSIFVTSFALTWLMLVQGMSSMILGSYSMSCAFRVLPCKALAPHEFWDVLCRSLQRVRILQQLLC